MPNGKPLPRAEPAEAMSHFAEVAIQAIKDLPSEESTLPISVVKISDGYHLVVNIRIEGKLCRMILDTAASRTIFDTKRIKKLIKDVVITNNSVPATTAGGNNIEQSSIQIKEVKLDRLIINDYRATLLDLAHINNEYKKFKHQPIDGVLGADILVEHKALIDLGEMELIF